MKISKTDLRK